MPFGSAVPEFGGGVFGGVVDCESAGGVPVVSAGGVAVVSLGGGAVCSAGGREFCDGWVPVDCCFEHAASSRSAPTLRNNALRFIGSPHCLGCVTRPTVGPTGRRGPNASPTQAFRCRNLGYPYRRNQEQAPAKVSATLRTSGREATA